MCRAAAGAGCSGEQDGRHHFFQGASAVETGVRSLDIHSQHRKKQVSMYPWRADLQQSGHPGYKGRIEDGTHPGKGLTLGPAVRDLHLARRYCLVVNSGEFAEPAKWEVEGCGQ